ncbi:adenylate/guanylate cyclase domain-containing protein [Cupriavidus numazuensis]|uniref:adenylate/guanylate cyclase domain-containing protein n=1 Tax=Cupriavidus numazuensis TaxID=221992 RepID=UPI001BAC2B61|nr:adenylate/guanylate cyclase domain-containing protein [Cupriavidus numazuensis]
MVHCAKCCSENADGASFCEQCGASLARACSRCGQSLSAAARFCNACGAPAGEFSQPASTAPIRHTAAQLSELIGEQAALEGAGERKTITVLFADMAGSTALIHDLDPEDAHRLITPVIELMMEAVHYYDGYVAKSLGDGILALFGAPVAREDHPQRAMYAALRMQEAMQRHSDRLRMAQGISLQIRVGIHSGEVVTRSIRKDALHTDYDPVGHTINIAARLETMAALSSILVSESTQKLAEGYFRFEALGSAELKGIPKPLLVYQLLGIGPLRTRLQVAAHRGLARFVGRERELLILQQALKQSTAGHLQIVGVVGEAGVGKSRLFHEFKARSPRQCLLLETFSVSHGKAFAYLPLIELLRNYFQITPQDDERSCREKVAGKVRTMERSLEDYQPYLLFLLGIKDIGSALTDMVASLRRERTFEAIMHLLVQESRNQPVELLFEDLQWLDRETDAFLCYLIERVQDARILILVNYRPEYRCAWRHRVNYTEVRLNPLGPAEAQCLLTDLLGDDPGMDALKQLILRKTEGNPFFMEEVVQTLIEEKVLLGDPGYYRIESVPAELHIPATVQGVLAARIDRLPVAEKELLQTLAVIGKEFTLSLVAQVSGQSEESLQPLLADLEAGEFIYSQPIYPEVGYVFKHALTQEVAGSSLLSEKRGSLHERTGRAIEALFHHQLKDHCSELAHHYSLSGNLPKAVEYLQCAGRQALDRSAHRDALHHLSAALELFNELPETQERAHLELSLRITLGQALIAARGYAAPEVETNYSRALTLCEMVGDTAELFQVRLGLRIFFMIRAKHETAYQLGQTLVQLSEKTQDPVWLAQAYTALGGSSFFHADFHTAQSHLEKGISHYRPEQHRVHAARYGQDPGVRGLSFLALTDWYLGYPEKAVKHSQEALILARKISQPISIAYALVCTAQVYQLRQEAELTSEHAEAAIALTAEQGFPYWLAMATILRGWALAKQGQSDAGIAQIRQGLAACRATGARVLRPYYLGLLAEAYADSGHFQAGWNVLSQSLTSVANTGEHCHEAGLLHLQGDLLLRTAVAQPDMSLAPQAAEASFLKAIAIARQQSAKSLELRASISLAWLWKEQGKIEASRQMLVPVCETITEQSDSHDWLQARDLLDLLHCANGR